MTEDERGDMARTLLTNSVSEGRYPISTAAGNFAFDFGASSGLLGGTLKAFRNSNAGRIADVGFNMLAAGQGGVAGEDPYGDYEANTGSSGITRFVPARPTGFSDDVLGRDFVDGAIGAAQFHPVTAIPATLISGSAHQVKHDNVRAKKVKDISELQAKIKALDPKSPNSRSELMYYAALLKGLSGTGEIARGTMGQGSYFEMKQAEDARRKKDSPLGFAFDAYGKPLVAKESDFSEIPQRIIDEGDKIMKFEADMSKVSNSPAAITYPLKRTAGLLDDVSAPISNWLSLDRGFEHLAGNLPGSFWSKENVAAYGKRREFSGDKRPMQVSYDPVERRDEIARLAEEAYPGVSPQQYFADRTARQEANQSLGTSLSPETKRLLNSRVLRKF